MDSKTKNKQGFNSIKQMINYVFGSGVKITENSVSELGEGYFNVIYEIKVKNRDVILKIAPPENIEVLSYEKNMIQAEVEIMKLVKETTDVPVPGIYYYDDSRKVCQVPYYFMEKISGASYSSIKYRLSAEEQYDIEHMIGKYSSEINKIEGNYFGYPGNLKLQGDNWRTVFIKLVQAVLLNGKKNNVDLGTSYEYIQNIVEKDSYVLNEVTVPKLVHWDLWDGNILVENNKITGIIDFERALWADPLMEYYFKEAILLDKPSPFMDGYGISAFTENELRRRRLYNIYLYLIMVIECSYREYEDDGQYNWAKDMLYKEVSELN